MFKFNSLLYGPTNHRKIFEQLKHIKIRYRHATSDWLL